MSSTVQLPVIRAGAAGEDTVAVEEPLEIRVGDKPVAVTMRTPGDDFDLAAGFLFTENVLTERSAIDTIRHWGSPNVVRVGLREGIQIDLQRLHRHFFATSSCGICGKSSIDAIRVITPPIAHALRVPAAVIASLPDVLRTQQKLFHETGGLHAAGLFTPSGELLLAREDIGRHNAVDKVIGARFLSGDLPLSETILLVSGRAGFEIVQKAAVAGIPIVAAVGAPSSLAVEIAREMNQTLIGFLREGKYNVYSGAQD